MRLFPDTHFDFLRFRRFWVAFSLVVLAVGAYEVLSGGLNLGIDFTGGRQIVLSFDSAPDPQQLRAIFRNAGLDVQIQGYGEAEEHAVMLRTKASGQKEDEAGNPIEQALAAAQANGELGAYEQLSADYVGPQIGSELRRKGVLAVALSLLGMLIYIWIRFELRFAIGAIMASIHDVLVTVSFVALSDLSFDLTTVAALLTVVGYSVNDTVVVFDRVRENRRSSRREPLERLINRSLNETLARTVMTSGTTLLATLSLLLFGGEALRSFSAVMSLGVVVGTYSTIYIAGPFTLLWDRLGLLGHGGAEPSRAGGDKPPAAAATEAPEPRAPRQRSSRAGRRG